MTIEVNPVGVKCNLACTYCYETEMREAGNYGPKDYDLAAMQAGLLDELTRARGKAWTLHGGEPLLMPLEDLEAMWQWGAAHGHEMGVQTNGSLITQQHIDLALRYRVHIGVSIDGPGDMNDLRARASLDKTRQATAASERALEACCRAGVATSVIVVLHQRNMDPARREQFKRWIRHLDTIGVRGIRFHPMELDGSAGADAPTVADYVAFYRDMRQFMETLPMLRIDLLQDIRALQRGQDQQTTCTWNTCDPYTTAAVHGVDGDGERHNCGRTNKDGVATPKAARAGFERYLALHLTPQAHGGCQGCRFFAMCTGQCPGEGIGGDWRNRSMYCGLYMALFEDVETEMLLQGQVPLSQAPDREQIEALMVDAWTHGRRLAIHQARAALAAPPPTTSEHADQPHGDAHGDAHGDSNHGDRHGDSPHGDKHDDCAGCHGDLHGDHTDISGPPPRPAP